MMKPGTRISIEDIDILVQVLYDKEVKRTSESGKPHVLKGPLGLERKVWYDDRVHI